MTNDRNLIRLACVLFAAKLVMLMVLAMNTRFVMDEFWQFGQSKYLWAGFYDTIWPVKSVGYALWYWPAHWLGWDATSTLLAGRVLAVGTVTATLGVVFATSRALGFSRMAALVSLILLLSVSTYMERSFRLRSETPAILFAALALWLLVAADGLPRLGRIAWAGLMTGCAFLCTQKAIYFNGALGLGLVTAFWLHASLPRAVVAGAVLFVGWAVALLVYGFVFGGFDLLAVLWHLAIGPADLAMNGGSLYKGLGQFIGQTLGRNIAVYSIFFIGLLLALTKLRRNAPGVTIAAVFTAILTALVFTHNQPWPYVFVMALPFLALWGSVLWMRFVARPERMTISLFAVMLVVMSSFVRNISYLDHNNQMQLDVIRSAETIVGPNGTYFDGIGMLPTHFESPRRWLDRSAIAQIEARRDDVVEALAATPPDLIIETSRTDRLPEAFAAWVAARYVMLAPGLLVPGKSLTPNVSATLIVAVPGRFVLEDPSQRLLIDSAPVHLPVDLAPGTYTLATVSADAPTRLIPEGVAIPARQAPRAPLFSAIYTR